MKTRGRKLVALALALAMLLSVMPASVFAAPDVPDEENSAPVTSEVNQEEPAADPEPAPEAEPEAPEAEPEAPEAEPEAPEAEPEAPAAEPEAPEAEPEAPEAEPEAPEEEPEPAAVEITAQPQDVTIASGGKAEFAVEAVGDGLTYRWQYATRTGAAWYNVVGAVGGNTDSILKIAATAARNGYKYRCVVTDEYGSEVVSAAAVLNVEAAGITAQPEDAAAARNSTAVFTVAVSGSVKSYLWQYKSAVGTKWYNLNSATQGYNKDTLKVKATSGRSGYLYRCVITMTDGTKLTSDAAALAVVNYPAIKQELQVGDELTVAVDAEEGAFPEGTEVNAEKVALDDVQKAVDEAEDVSGTVLYAVDITFTKDGEELQPAEGKTVKVSFTAPELKDVAEDAAVVHIDAETNKAEPVETVEAEGENAVCFKGRKFSVYAVVGENQVTPDSIREINFYKDSTLIATMRVKENDPDTEREKIIYDPGVGTLEDNKIFRGWTTDPNYGDDVEPMNIAKVREEAYKTPIKQGEVMNFYAVIFDAYKIIYLDPDGKTLHSDVLLMREASDMDYTIKLSYTSPNPNCSFVGWAVMEDTADNVTPKNSSVQPPYPVDTEVVVSGDVVLIADAPEGNWLIFDANGSGASYTAPQFIVDREGSAYQRVTKKPKDPIRHGYEFKGWFDNPEGDGTEYQFGDTIDERTTLYAKWKLNESANYAVIVWKQRMSDTYSENRNNKNYDFAEAIVRSGTVGDPITLVSLTGANVTDGDGKQYPNAVIENVERNSSYQNGKYLGYHCARADQEVTIKADGSSVVNVYYDRNVVTYTFFTYANGAHQSYMPTFGDDAPQYGYIDGEYKELTRVSGYVYSSTTSNNGTQYGLVDGEYVELNRQQEYVYTSTTSNANNPAQYGIVDGQYVQLTRVNGSYEPTTATGGLLTEYYGLYNGQYVRVYENNGTWYRTRESTGCGGYNYSDPYDGQRYTHSNSGYHWTYNNRVYTDTRYTRSQQYVWYNGSDRYTSTRYTRAAEYFWYYDGEPYTMQRYTLQSSTGAGWSMYQNEVGYYGEELDWPEDNSYWWYPNGGNNGSTSGTRMTYKNDFLPLGSDMNVSYYGRQTTGQGTIIFQTQNYPDTENYTTQATVTTAGGGTFTINDKFAGYYAYQYQSDNGNWQSCGTLNPSTGYYDEANFNSTLTIRFNRKKSDIVFLDGGYFEGKDGKTPVDVPASTDEFEHVSDVLFGADISSYGPDGDDYIVPEPYYEGYTFAGWFADKTCTLPYTFTEMPDGGLTVYAKWVKTMYRVFLHPNALIENDDGDLVNDQTLDWGGDQAMNFSVANGEYVQNVVGTRKTYEFVGWFRDETLRTPFIAENIKLSDDTVPASPAYDKTKDMTDDMNKFGEIIDPDSASNSDVNRPWVTRKLDLYGKWRAVIVGADGIDVEYDVGDSSSEISDPLHYLDGTWVFAQNAPTPNDEDSRFLKWVIQTWDEDEGKFVDSEKSVYPGDTFEVLLSNARQEALPDNTPANPSYKYTVKLRAEYVLKQVPTPTHIDFFKNDGTEVKAASFENLGINQPVDIPAPVSRGDYIFLGWARVLEEETTEGSGEYVLGRDPTKPDEDPLTEDDVYLVWVPDTTAEPTRDGTPAGHYETKEGVPVTQVAADEVMPYHDMFAVWADYFNVVYSHDPEKVYKVPFVTEVTDGTRAADNKAINLVAGNQDVKGYELPGVDKNYFYGGYYTKMPEAGGSWAWADACKTDKGSAFKSYKAKETYYVKEVAKNLNHLRTIYRYTYKMDGTNRITWFCVISSIDDLNYTDAGYMVGDMNVGRSGIKKTIKIQNKAGTVSADNEYAVVDRTSFNVATAENDARLVYLTFASVPTNTDAAVTPYWITPDGETVLGRTRTYTFDETPSYKNLNPQETR